uniref:Metalloprotease 1 n=1 Tax=Rhipicephalus microplus TaxID=6941 RepID=A0A068LE08_RHIMP|nr:metalloprotease 1 [Rhipicephalus microplus]
MRVFIIILQFAFYSDAEKDAFVYPTILQERSTERNLVLRLNDKFTLNLQRSSVLADKLLFVTTSDEVNHLEEIDTSAIQKTLYHDTHYQSSVRVQQRDDAVQVEGIINDKLRIKPVPEGERSMKGQILHKIYEVNNMNEGSFIAEEKPRKSHIEANVDQNPSAKPKGVNSRRIEERRNREEFEVELHIICDQKHQSNFDKNEDLIGYMAVFMNAANLRYLDIRNPKVRFLLVGITREKGKPFRSRHSRYTDTTETLNRLQAYEAEKKVPGKHDALLLVTGLDLVKVQNGHLEKGIAGRAFMAAVCSSHGVGVAEDTATTYMGVNTVAHELAHILGSDHDTSPRCPWREGYLMSYVDGGLRKYRLSQCSQDSIRDVYRGLNSQCKRVLTKVNYMDKHREFPGETVGVKYYCRKRIFHYTKGKKVKAFALKGTQDAQNCKMQCCYWQGNMRTCWPTPMLERMTCLKGKTCKRGVCGVHEW